MPRAEEIAHYSQLAAGLIVSAARARRPEDLREIHDELAEAFADMWTLLSHDTFERARPDLAGSLLAAAEARARETGTRA